MHVCSGWEFEEGLWGTAIGKCEENEDGELWVDNDEYATRVNYCPFCGYKAKKQVKLTNGG